MDQREARLRAAEEHVQRTRKLLADGKSELERQRASVDATEEHLTGMQRWIEQTERALGEENRRR
jgi:outer membrane protein TolC